MTKEINIDLMKSLFEYKNGNLYWKTDRFSVKTKGKIAGYICNGRKIIKLKYRSYQVHKIIYAIHYGSIPKCVKHIDGNKLNNEISNLKGLT
jgi:hypothetical protein